MTSGSFHHHFGSWAGFVRRLLQYWEDEQAGRVVGLARAGPDPLERARVVRRLTVELQHEAEAALRAWAQLDPEVDCYRRSAMSVPGWCAG